MLKALLIFLFIPVVTLANNFDGLLGELNSQSEFKKMKAAVKLGELDTITDGEIDRLVIAATSEKNKIRTDFYTEKMGGSSFNIRGTRQAYASAALVFLGESAAQRLIDIYESNSGAENGVRAAFFVLQEMRNEYAGDNQFQNAVLAGKIERIVSQDKNGWAARSLPLLRVPRTPPPAY